MMSAVGGTALLCGGGWLCYRSHPNQRFGARPLPQAGRWIGLLLLLAGTIYWTQFAGIRAGLAVAVVELMLFFSVVPLLSLLSRSAS